MKLAQPFMAKMGKLHPPLEECSMYAYTVHVKPSQEAFDQPPQTSYTEADVESEDRRRMYCEHDRHRQKQNQDPAGGTAVRPSAGRPQERPRDRKSTRLNSSHLVISYA